MKPDLFTPGIITDRHIYSDATIGTVAIVIVQDKFPPRGMDLGPLENVAPHHNYITPYHIPFTVIRISEECGLSSGDSVETVAVQLVTTAENCPVAIEGYIPPIDDETVWGDVAEIEPSELPNLALVRYNEVVALESPRCEVCPREVQLSCLLYQTALRIRNSRI